MERSQYLLPPILETRFLVLYGKGVDDTYISERLIERGLPETLLACLKERGYRRVVFFSPHRSIYYLDQDSPPQVMPVDLPRSKPSSGELRGQTEVFHQSRMQHLSGGPLGDIMLLEQDPPADGGIPLQEDRSGFAGMGDVHAIRALDAFMRDTQAPPTAVVFTQSETTFRYFEDPRTLAGLLGEWLSLPAANPHLCILLFSVETYPRLSEVATGLPVPELRHFLARPLQERSRISSLVQVGGPGAQEIRQLLAYLHHEQGLQVKPEDINQLCRWMAAENLPATQWARRLHGLGYLSIEIASQKGWFSGRQAVREAPTKRLAALIGLQEVKQRLFEITAASSASQSGGAVGSEDAPAHHLIFTGNPGTGKTTVARLVGEILHEGNVLRRGHLVEARAADLISDHVGGTALKTNELIDQALDGVLFIDEAYSLADSARGGYGQESIETLMTRMEDERQRLVVIAAGYPDRMEKFLSANPGMRRRFPRDHILHFPDYSEKELIEILRRMLRKRKLACPVDVEQMLASVVGELYAARDAEFGNAGEMRNLADGLRVRCTVRLQGQNVRRLTLALEDLPDQYRTYLPLERPDIDQLFIELDQLVGLKAVKEHLRRMVRRIQLEQLRVENDGRWFSAVSLPHLIFAGNPGTGKTTVARLLGRFFCGLGLLKKGHCVEVGRADLVAGFVGQTAERTMDRVRQALDGILFIDEAYALSRGGDHDFGQEVIDTLVKAMEDFRGRLVIIVAGYPDEIESFIRSNTGLRSRFAAPISFPDYQDDELVQILLGMAASEGYNLTEDAVEGLLGAFHNRRLMEGKAFGNGREAREVFETMKGNMAERILQEHEAHQSITVADLNTLRGRDIPTLQEDRLTRLPDILSALSTHTDPSIS